MRFRQILRFRLLSLVFVEFNMLMVATSASRRSMLCRAFVCPPSLRKQRRATDIQHVTTSFTQRYLSSRSPVEGMPRKVAIVGGGLAGLSTAFHLLEKSKQLDPKSPMKITILDKAPVGTSGASSVAGGLLHPLSPKGKLVHWGLEGLEATNRLVQASAQHIPTAVLRTELYRVALSETNVSPLQQTARDHEDFCKWVDANDMNRIADIKSSWGGLLLQNGCCVLHVPSYLQGLWEACVELSGGTATWELFESTNIQHWQERLQPYDAVVLSAGAGLWHDSILSLQSKNISSSLPVDLIRGQSLEMKLPTRNDNNSKRLQPPPAVLCGKYISPLPKGDNLFLLGATHEHKIEPLSPLEVESELRQRSYELAPHIWEDATVEQVTCGYRVQSKRGAQGRLPIMGRLAQSSNASDEPVHEMHPNLWIFTGLSSRGLLYHGIYGNVLAGAILEGNEENMLAKYPHINWWRRQGRQSRA